MNKLLSQVISASIGLWLAALVVPEIIVRAYPASKLFGFNLEYQWEIFILLGIVLGLLNYFLKPILKMLSLPLEVITLGLFTVVIDMGLIWILDSMFDELYVPLWLPLLYASLIILVVNIVIGLIFKKK